MNYLEIILISMALAMDCFAVSLSGWTLLKKPKLSQSLLVALYFWWFQLLFTVFWWVLWNSFSNQIENFDHWIAFVLLAFIWWKMIYEWIFNKDESSFQLTHKTLFILAIATSIDAFWVWLSIALLDNPIVIYSISIWIASFIFSIIWIYTWNLLNKIIWKKAEIIWWIILLLIWFNILNSHIGI